MLLPLFCFCLFFLLLASCLSMMNQSLLCLCLGSVFLHQHCIRYFF
jgi:hypothetical protein